MGPKGNQRQKLIYKLKIRIKHKGKRQLLPPPIVTLAFDQSRAKVVMMPWQRFIGQKQGKQR
jgi:hypothetical protein